MEYLRTERIIILLALICRINSLINHWDQRYKTVLISLDEIRLKEPKRRKGVSWR